MPEPAYSITDDEQAAYEAKQLDDEWQSLEDQQALDDLWRTQTQSAQTQPGAQWGPPDEFPRSALGNIPGESQLTGDADRGVGLEAPPSEPNLSGASLRGPTDPFQEIVEQGRRVLANAPPEGGPRPETLLELAQIPIQVAAAGVFPSSLEARGLTETALGGPPGKVGKGGSAGEALRGIRMLIEGKIKALDTATRVGAQNSAARLSAELDDLRAVENELLLKLIPEEVKGGVPPPERLEQREEMLTRREGKIDEAVPADPNRTDLAWRDNPQAAEAAAVEGDLAAREANALQLSRERDIPPEEVAASQEKWSVPSAAEKARVLDRSQRENPLGEVTILEPAPLRELSLPTALRGEHVIPIEEVAAGPRVAPVEAPSVVLRGGEVRAYEPPSVVPPRGPGEPPSTVLPEGSGDELARLHKAANLPPAARKQPFNIYHQIQRWFTDENVDINAVSTGSREARSAFLGVQGGGFTRAERELAPVFTAAGKDGLPFLNDYLAVQRDLEVRAAKGNPERGGIAGFASVEESQKALQQLQQHLGPAEFKRIEGIANQVYDTYGRLLQEKVDAGLVSQDVADWLRKNYPNYSSTIITHYLDDVGNKGGSGAGAIQQMQNTLKRLTEEGTFSNQLPPMQAAIKAQMEGHVAIERNYLLRTIAEDGGFHVRPYKAGDEKTAAVFWIDGKRVAAEVDPDLARSINRLDTEQLNTLLKIASASNALLRNTAVTYNPVFVLVNPVADAFGANFQVGANPLRTVQAAVAGREKDPIYQLMAERGGLMSLTGGGWHSGESQFTMNPDFHWKDLTSGHIRDFLSGFTDKATMGQSYRYEELEKAVAKSGGVILQPSKIDGLTKLFTAAPEAVREAGEAAEMATRAGVFRRELENAFVIANGAKPKNTGELVDWANQPENRGLVNHAITVERRSTMDFARFGKVMRTINALHPFSNVGEQAALNLFRALRDNPSSRYKAIGLVTAGATAYAWNHQPQFEDRYEAIPAYEKEVGTPLLLPGGVRSKDGKDWKFNPHITIPTRSLSMFTSLGDELAKFIVTKATDPVAAIDRIIGAVNPIPDSNVKSNSGLGPTSADVYGRMMAMGIGLLPVPIQSAIEIGVNTNTYTGAPVVPEATKQKHVNSPQLWIGEHTTEAAQRIGKLTDVPPLIVDFWINRNFAGVGRMGMQGASTLMGQESDKPPVVGGLLSGIYRTTGGELINDAYDKRDVEISKIQKIYKDTFTKMALGGAPVASPPTNISIDAGGTRVPIPLLPQEQAQYLSKKMQKVQELVLKYQGRIAPMSVDQYKMYLKLIDDEGDKFAVSEMTRTIPREQIKQRARQYAENQRGINPRDYVTEEQFVPDLAPAGVR